MYDDIGVHRVILDRDYVIPSSDHVITINFINTRPKKILPSNRIRIDRSAIVREQTDGQTRSIRLDG